MLKTSIIGREKQNEVIVSDDGFLYTKTKPYYQYENKVISFTNDVYGDNLAINASISASSLPEYVNDGGDNTYWTLSIISNFFNDFVISTNQNNTPGGSQSVDFSGDEDGDIAQFTRPSGLIDLTNFISLSGYIYLTSWPQTDTKQMNFYGWNTNTNTQVGVMANIGNYISTTTLNTWQRFVIPLSDLNLTNQTIDAIRLGIVDIGIGAAPDGYLDDIQFDAINPNISGPQIYEVKSIIGKVLQIESISFCMVLPHTSILTDNSMLNFSYNKLGDINELENGILYRRIQNNETKSSWLLKNLKDFIKRPYAFISNVFGDNTYTTINIRWEFAENHVLNYGSRDKISITISDDFSELQHFSIITACKVRDEE